MISVCIPTYNGEKYIVEQVRSILKQLSEDDEIIISDDESSDDTIKLLLSLADNRIKIYNHPACKCQYKGALRGVYLINRNLNNALSKAKGDIIFVADQDDVWVDGKVQKVMTALSDADLVLHDCKVINKDMEVLTDSFFTIHKPHTSFWGTLYRTSYMGCCMAFNRQLLNHALPFPDYAVEHDTWLGFCAIRYGRIKVLEEPLILYRRHSDNVSPCFDGSMNSLFTRLKRRTLMIKAYLSLLLRK